MDSWSREIRYALRGLLHRPAFGVAAILTLALGLGATAAIFSVVNAVLLKPLPYPNADRLVALSHAAPGLGDGRVGLAQSMYFTYLDETRTLQNVGLYGNGGASVTGVGDPEQARALFVTHGVLPALGVQPMRGRPFTEADDAPAAEGPNPVIITHAYWQRKFGGDPAIIGRSMTIDARPSEIIGVMPENFRFLNMQPEAEILLPIRPNRAQAVLGNIGGGLGLAELKPGVTIEEANADVARMLRIWLDSWPPPVGGVGRETIESGWRLAPALHPLKDLVVGSIATTLWVLMGTIAAVLMIACANIANLMLVRADARRSEIAIRAALGASRTRLVRVFFTESLVLGVIGGILGLAIAYAGLELLVAFGPQTLPRLQEIAIDPLVLAFVAMATLASSLFLGSIPAIKHTLYVDPRSTRGGARGATAGRETHRARNVLVVAQVALALVLIVCAGLMIRTFEALRDVDPGFTHPESIQVARIWAAPVGRPVPSEYTRLERDILEGIEALPGVQSAAFGFGVPMEGRSIPNALFVEDFPQAEGEAPPTRRFKYISPGWFATLGTRIVAGRDITWTDIDNGGKVVVISEALARELWGTPVAALGKRVRETVPTSTSAWREIVGVVQDVREDSLQQAPPPPGLLARSHGGFRRRRHVRHAGDRLCDPHRTRRHGELRQRGAPIRVVRELKPTRLPRTHDAGSVRGFARAGFVHAGDARDRGGDGARLGCRWHRGRHGVCRVATHARDRHPGCARRASCACQEHVPQTRARPGCGRYPGWACSRRCADSVHGIVAVRRDTARCAHVWSGARCHIDRRRDRELLARAPRCNDLARGDAQERVTAGAPDAQFRGAFRLILPEIHTLQLAALR